MYTARKQSDKMVSRRCVCSLSAFLTVTCVFGVYYTYFKHPPPDELMRMNNRRTIYLHNSLPSNRSTSDRDRETGGVVPVRGNGRVWNDFLRLNKLVSVGEVFDKACDDERRTRIGVVVMLPDQEAGGVKTRTFVNYTLDEDIEEGEFYIEVKYNQKDLFDNHWDLCTVEEDVDPLDRTIYCPVKKGFRSQTKDRKIPNYLPKGQYYTKCWITNSEGDVIMCGYSDFVL